MALSTFALVIAVFEFLIGLPLVLFPKETTEWVIELTRSDLLYRTVGGLFLVICVLVLSEGISVGTDVASLVRLMAWLAAVKCLVICWWPERHSQLAARMLSKRGAQRIYGVTAIGFGVLLSLASITLR